MTANLRDNIVGAFSEEQAERLTGLSRSQLRYWDRTGFFEPAYGRAGGAFGRIYSFRDLVALRVLGQLRNRHQVPLQHLREVAEKLSHLADAKWTGTKLWVLNKRVVFEEPETLKKREVVDGQYVLEIPLQVVISETRKHVAELNARGQSVVGQVERSRFVAHNAPVIAGTRITVAAVRRYAEAGFTPEQIVQEYPDLTVADVEAALAYKEGLGSAA
jgi:uncharacterized protein (DUF433 family)